MTAESEVAISFAISIFSNQEFKADDDRLNYQSYKELGLICGKCRELIFFKQGTERVSHFSHFKSTGKDCKWRTGSDSNTLHIDSKSREQSLEKFQKQFEKLIKQRIIKYQKISPSQLRGQIAEGQRLVSRYKIDIDSWLRWFNHNREKVKIIAQSFYQSNQLVPDANHRIILNFLDYLCVPASEYILREILYYVVFVLNKERGVNNDFEKVCSKVIEIIIFADWQKEYQIAPITLKGIDHPNVEEKTPKVQVKTEQKIPKPVKLDGQKTAPGSLMMRGIIGHTPMLLTIEPADSAWNLIALPIRVPQYDLAVYLSDKIGRRELALRIQSYIDELSKLITRNEIQIKLLETLLTDVLEGRLPSRQDVLNSTRTIEKYLNNEHIKQKSAYSDNYYRLYTLGYAKIIQKVETQLPTYTLTIMGDEKDTRRSEIPTAIRWLKTQPNIIQKHFAEKLGTDLPSFTDVKKFLMSTFPYHKSVTMIISDREVCEIELYYNNKLQTRQRLVISKPANQEKTFGKLPVQVSTTITWTNDNEFKHLLRCDANDSRLIIGARTQIEAITQKFINSNLKRFVGEEKIINRKPLRDILGFREEARNYGHIQRTFYKFATPYTLESEVDGGKMVNLHTLEVYDRHHITKLLELMTANWRQWNQNKPEKIQMGGCEFKPIDPGALMIQVFNTIKNNPSLDAVIWGEFLNHLYLMTKLPIGFRCQNGVLLTPWDILPDKQDLWAYRLKIQYIDILYKGKKSKIELAEYFLAQDSQELKDKGKQLKEESRKYHVQSWLEYSLKDLEDQLNKYYPQWQQDISENLEKHIQALKNALLVCKKVK